MSLAMLLGPLNTTAFTVGHTTFSWLQTIGFATGVLNVWLVARQNLWNWPLGIVHPFLQMLIYGTAGLFADSGLQAIYILMNAYGWWAWAFGGKAHGALGVSRTPKRTAWML
ncbi:MAG TPA: nicotinamide mononucleotide transporter family protein, partial [Oscillatoriaceae cyanobacterium]